MGLFNSNKRGNTSQRSKAKDRRGDLHIAPLVSDWEKTHMIWNDLTHSCKDTYALFSCIYKHSYIHKSLLKTYRTYKGILALYVHVHVHTQTDTQSKSTLWRTMLSRRCVSLCGDGWSGTGVVGCSSHTPLSMITSGDGWVTFYLYGVLLFTV